ncbi:hypothetical protein [Taibaiella sp. KBW10]|uniref:hypothetical protein n=1 Tax=Taibaiella sp. KBW10 TaxID=2153357 RepID=UPI000F5A6FFD|nr:hypothetical protein [Taibaiella sp. KBW10]
MKRIYLFVMMLLCSSALFAQAPSAYSLRVVNQTNCPVFYSVIGDEICVCGRNYQSGIMSLAPGGTATYANTTFFPLPGSYPPIPKGITGALIYSGSPACQNPTTGVVGQPAPACTLPLNYSYLGLGYQCERCSDIRVRWIPANNCQEYAQLIFY